MCLINFRYTSPTCFFALSQLCNLCLQTSLFPFFKPINYSDKLSLPLMNLYRDEPCFRAGNCCVCFPFRLMFLIRALFPLTEISSLLSFLHNYVSTINVYCIICLSTSFVPFFAFATPLCLQASFSSYIFFPITPVSSIRLCPSST